MRAEITSWSGSNTARDARDMARRRLQNGTVPEREGPTGALLAAAERDNVEVVLDVLSLVDDPERKGALAAQALALAAKYGCEAVCTVLVDLCRQKDLGSVFVITFFIYCESMSQCMRVRVRAHVCLFACTQTNDRWPKYDTCPTDRTASKCVRGQAR